MQYLLLLVPIILAIIIYYSLRYKREQRTEKDREKKIDEIDKSKTFWEKKQNIIAVHTFIDSFFPSFDIDKYAEKIANIKGLDATSLKNEWIFRSKSSLALSDFIHRQIDNILYSRSVNNDFVFDDKESKQQKHFNISTELAYFNRFLLYYIERNKIIDFELNRFIYSPTYELSAKIDAILTDIWGRKYILKISSSKSLLSKKESVYQINKSNQYNQKAKDPIAHLDDSYFNRLSLRLSAYKKILKDERNIEVYKTLILILSKEYEDYILIDADDKQKEFISLLNFTNR